MSKKKTSRKRSSSRKKVVHRRTTTSRLEKNPEYMVQVSEPKILRKDMLESLREVILFMQGYEKFKSIQDEKIKLFKKLKLQVREIDTLVQGKLSKLLPKGKLKAVQDNLPSAQDAEIEDKIEELEVVDVKKEETARTQKYEQARETRSELDLLEDQLKSIEDQLTGLN